MTARTPHEPSESLIDAVLEAASVLLRVAARSVVQVEDVVSSPQLRILVFVARQGPVSSTAVARELNVHPSNATRMCDRLVRDGLLARNPDPRDGRFVRLELTDAGRELVTGVFAQRRADVAEVLREIPLDRRDMVREGFEVLAHAAGDEISTDGRFLLTPPQAGRGGKR
jgi:DNA-binding MarR family transcriptional regulator